MKAIYLILTLILLLPFSNNAQTDKQRKEIKSELNLDRAKHTNTIIKKLYLERQKRIQNFLKAKNITNKTYIHKIYDVIDGEPVLRTTDNMKAAKLTKTTSIQPNGDLGLNLEGDGYVVGVWDANGVMIEHVEFKQGEISRVTKGDQTFGYSGHATHVAGTIAASGARAEAKGMAPKAAIRTFDWNSDDVEVGEAAMNGLLISNHSYGIPVFNDGEQVSDAKRIGAYIENSYIWDLLPFTYEYYLPVISAGNDGKQENSEPIQPTFDKLMGNKTSKNVMVVANSTNALYSPDGSFLSDPFINESSSEGPTNDGRVKPDIAGMGTGLLSSYFVTEEPSVNNNYANSTGTSMSAPNVAGTLLLLQELSYNTHNAFLKNYELKNLVIHTAYDPSTSAAGPDPFFGWGVLNARKAAETILEKNSDDVIFDHLNLSNGNSISINVSLLEPKDFKASIAWNDIPGFGVPDTYQDNFDLLINNPEPALINDLDIRLINTATNTEYLPWKLDISKAYITASRSDNNVDNVEKIEQEQLSAGNYTLIITHKNNLINESQDFSLIISGIDNSETLNADTFEKEHIALWPNPVKNRLNISSSEISFSDEVQVSVYDMLGREVINLKDFNSTNNLSIDMSSLSKGIYILKLTDAAQSIQKRIIKE